MPFTLDEFQLLADSVDMQSLVVRAVTHWRTGPAHIPTTDSEPSTSSHNDALSSSQRQTKHDEFSVLVLSLLLWLIWAQKNLLIALICITLTVTT